MKVLASFIFTLISVGVVFAQNEQSPVVEKQIDYKNWSYNNVRTGEKISLRDFAAGKKLVMVVYFAPWCPNWKHEAPFAEALYEKYKSADFDVIGVSEYDNTLATIASLDSLKITFPVVSESDTRDAKNTTMHYQYRTATGDKRKWGSPWNLFILSRNLEKNSDIIEHIAPVVNGELIEADVEKFVQEMLGVTDKLTAATKKKDAEVCDPEKQTTTLKKP